MKTLRLLAGLVLLPALWHPATAQTPDPTFTPSSIYGNGSVYSALEQPDGKRVITGTNYVRINGQPASAISRFNPDGSLDLAFQQNVGAAPRAYRTKLLSNGQFMLGYSSSLPFTVGGITRQTLLRLNANGSGDATFDSGTGPVIGGSISYVDDFLPLPNGQLLIVGGFDHYNGVAINSIARLTTTGAVDPTFNPGQGVDPNSDDILNVAALPNGQILISGIISSYDGHPVNGLARLNADGSYDASFVQSLGQDSEVDNILVQPDGKILVAGYLFGTTNSSLVRLLPNGAADPSFTAPASVGLGAISSYSDEALQLQPDGKILYITNYAAGTGTLSPSVSRLNANGTQDASFQAGVGAGEVYSLTLLANGKILIGGTFPAFSGAIDRSLLQLTSTGAIDASFQPVIQSTGAITTVVRQADGKLLAGGNFSEINGQSVRRLARFNANGTLDTSFPTNLGLDFSVIDVALQSGGQILVATSSQVRRFQPSGAADNSFSASSLAGIFTRLLVQPDDRVLVGGIQIFVNGGLVPAGLARLLSNGAQDASFAPTLSGTNRLTAFRGGITQQPNGKLLVTATYLPTTGSSIRSVVRLETNGAVDATFSPKPFTSPTTSFGNKLVVQPDGKVLVGGNFSAVGGVARTSLARLNADGTLDAGFTPPTISGTVNTLLLQPNNRVLVGGSFSGAGLPNNLARVLGNGTADATFAASAVPNGAINSLLVQPDGAIVLGGNFTNLSGTPMQALARITASNVLAVAAPAAVAARTAAWPVPAHEELTVQPDPGAHAQSIELVDLLGRNVHCQALSGSQPAVVPVQTLPAGIYLLRVNYAEGTVTRRIQVQ